MRWIPTVVESRRDEGVLPALVASCPVCLGHAFYLTLIGPNQLSHTQCTDCQTVYCDGHSCTEEGETHASET